MLTKILSQQETANSVCVCVCVRVRSISRKSRDVDALGSREVMVVIKLGSVGESESVRECECEHE